MKIFLAAILILAGLSRLTFAQYSVQLDLTEQKAYLLYNDRAIMDSQISSGRPGHLTPAGTFFFTTQVMNHVSNSYGRIFERRGRTVVADNNVDMKTSA